MIGRFSTCISENCILYSVSKWEFSPGKPDLCSDQTTPFGRSKGGGTYRYRGSFSISHDHCAGYFGRSPIRVSTKSVAENCLAPLVAKSTIKCNIVSFVFAICYSFLVLGWKKTAKIQKKWDLPKGQPHFLTLKIVYP